MGLQPGKGWAILSMRSKLKALLPWLMFFLLLLLPLYAISASLAIRSGVFDLQDKSISGDEYKALWAFIASGIGTAATIVGLLFARAHNQRTADQLALDTVVKSLELLVVDEGKYAPKARIAGALAALIHLGHPTIAMRTLAAAWQDQAVDASAACWLISEVFKTGADDSKTEGAFLLELHANALIGPERGAFNWPPAVYEKWKTDLPIDARISIVFALAKLLLSRPRDWWLNHHGWIVATFDEVLRKDRDPGMRDTVALFLRALLEGEPLTGTIGWGKESKDLKSIRAGLAKHGLTSGGYVGTWTVYEELQAWIRGTDKASSVGPTSTDVSSALPSPGGDGNGETAEGGRRPPAGRP